MITLKRFVYLFLIALFCVSLASNVFLIFYLTQMTNVGQTYKVDLKVLTFRDMFTRKVLMATGEIDFGTRLELENAVRALNDQEIFNQWERFTKSATKEDASYEAKELLNLLVKKTWK